MGTSEHNERSLVAIAKWLSRIDKTLERVRFALEIIAEYGFKKPTHKRGGEPR